MRPHAPARWNAPRGPRKGGAWRHSASGQSGGQPLPGDDPASVPAVAHCRRPWGCFRRNRSRRCRPGHVPRVAVPAPVHRCQRASPDARPSMSRRRSPHAGRTPPRQRSPRLPPPSLSIDGAAHDRRTCQRFAALHRCTRTPPPAMPAHGPQDARRGVAVAFPTAGPPPVGGPLVRGVWRAWRAWPRGDDGQAPRKARRKPAGAAERPGACTRGSPAGAALDGLPGMRA